MKEDLVEIIEIWRTTTGENATAFDWKTGEKLEKIAIIVGGQPLYLDESVILEIGQRTPEEAKHLTESITQKKVVPL